MRREGGPVGEDKEQGLGGQGSQSKCYIVWIHQLVSICKYIHVQTAHTYKEQELCVIACVSN